MSTLIFKPRLPISLLSRSLSFSSKFSTATAFNPRFMTTGVRVDWKLVDKPGAIPYHVFTKPIEKSEQDDRGYRVIELGNGLQATLIHDANSDKSAASLDVAVGHLYDPDDMPGLAHFCEHLLFMGTETFPQENEYSEFLAKNNGGSNAYTSTSNTNYYFNVATSALPGALERFAAFFHCPLFAPSCTSRELNAVDSEHKKNHQTDMWRIFQLNKHLTKPGHVWSKFGSGNRESLSKHAKVLQSQGKLVSASPTTHVQTSPPSDSDSESEADGGEVGRETRRRLVEWWSKEYCASRMRLAVVGKESLDELSDLVVRLFSAVPNRGRDALPMINDHPFGPEQKGTLVSVQTVMSFHALEISFPLAYQAPFWRHKPATFISHFVGHEGPGSLHSYLKNKHWVTTLSCGPQNLARGFAMFKITVRLTPEGFDNYKSVILAAYKYLDLLRTSTFEDYHHKEVVNLSNIRFRFAEKRRPDDYATGITEHMAWPTPREKLLTGPKLTWDWENETDRQQGEARIRQYLESFRINESRVVLMAKQADHEKVHPGLQWEKEPWYGTAYAVQRFDDDMYRQANGPNDIADLFLPGPNEFIPSNLDVDKKAVVEPLKRPHLIRQTDLSTLWYKKDDKFWVPKAHVMIDLRRHVNPIGNASARAFVLTRLYSDIVNDSLTEYSYDAELAGLVYTLAPRSTGLIISMSGYNDKLSVLVRHVLEKVKGVVVSPKRLEVIKDEARRKWQNFYLEQSYSLSDFYASYIMAERVWTMEERLEELDAITPEHLQKHIQELLSQVSVRILAVGNLYKDEAIRIAEMVETGVGKSSASAIELNDRCLLLPKGSNHVWSSPIPNPDQANSALTYFTYFGPVADERLRVTSSLLTQILSEPAFNVLRTREQLGYIVSCTPWELPGASEKGLRIVVQSERKPNYLESRVEAFFDEMKEKLENLSADEFESHRSGLEKQWLEVSKNIGEEFTKYMFHVNSGHWDFLRREKDANMLKSITKDEVVGLFMTHVHPSSKTRSKLSIHMVSQKATPPRISAGAIQAFEVILCASAPDINAKGWHSVCGTDAPTLKDFGSYWMKTLSPETARKVLIQLPDLLRKYPAEGDEAFPPDVSPIKDIKNFKASLQSAVDPGPMVEWNDLPVPKF